MSLWAIAALLAVVSAVRLTRLITHDDITRSMRVRLERRGDEDLLWRLMRCPWCIGFWISAFCMTEAWLVAAHPALPWWYMIPAEILTCSHIVGLTAGWEPD